RRQPAKVLMTADATSGVWTYVVELVRALQKYEISIVLATMGAPLTRGQREEVGCIPTVEVCESNFELERRQDPWYAMSQAGEWLLQLEERVQPDVVHLNDFAQAILPWHAPTLVVGHACALSWWQAVKGKSAPAVWDRYRQEIAQGLRSATLVLAPSRTMLAALREHYGPFPAGWVVPNGRDPALFRPGVKENCILTVGELWDDAQNVAALARIAPQLSWPVYVAGEEQHPDGEVGAGLALPTGGAWPVEPCRSSTPTKMKLPHYPGTAQLDNVHLLGRLSPQVLALWFARVSVYALPARSEPCGLSVLEAGLAGCALVLGDIAGLRETWDGVAIFVPPDDAEVLSATLEALRRDPVWRQVMAARARRRAVTFTPQQMAAGYMTAYGEVITKALKGSQERTLYAL
ncbi:MAG: glycosyltransferase family 4 protein, partial [Candidatus Binatia bacterium]